MGKRLKKIDNDWYFNDNKFELTYEEVLEKKYYGFIYLIEEVSTGMKYVGQKCFHSFRTPPGKKNKKKFESDWKQYCSSNKVLSYKIKQTELERNDKYKFKMLALCKDKSVLNYCEARMMMIYNVLGSDKYYNENLKLNILVSYDDYYDRVEECKHVI
jgi:hypothetical protein